MKNSLAATAILAILTSPLSAAAPAPAAEVKPDVEKRLVLKFERYGGFAGFHDNISIFADFSYQLVAPDKKVFEGTLTADLQKQLTEQLAHYGDWVKAQSDGPGVDDGMETRIEIHGSGDTGSDGDLRDLHRLLHQIVTAAKTASRADKATR